MTNRRTLRKRVSFVCGQMAAECLIARTFIEGTNAEALDDCIREIAALQTLTLARVNVRFDKAPRDFASLPEYRHARRAYFAKAYKALTEEFNASVRKIVEQMNKALPARAEKA